MCKWSFLLSCRSGSSSGVGVGAVLLLLPALPCCHFRVHILMAPITFRPLSSAQPELNLSPLRTRPGYLGCQCTVSSASGHQLHAHTGHTQHCSLLQCLPSYPLLDTHHGPPVTPATTMSPPGATTLHTLLLLLHCVLQVQCQKGFINFPVSNPGGKIL